MNKDETLQHNQQNWIATDIVCLYLDICHQSRCLEMSAADVLVLFVRVFDLFFGHLVCNPDALSSCFCADTGDFNS